jgi:hypothetical protein
VTKPTFATNDVPNATDFNEWLVNINFARKTSNESVTSSTTNQADDQLFVPVQANAVYVVLCVLAYTGATAGDLKVLFRVPSGGGFQGMGTTLVVGAASQQDIQSMPYGVASEVWGCLGAGTSYGKVDGLLTTAGTAGDFAIDWAQNTSNATPTTIQAGSFLSLLRVS